MPVNNPCQQKNCHLCCMNTYMLLSNDDIQRIYSHGYKKQMFVREQDGWPFLKNNGGRCVFHNGSYCTIYALRPQGCTLYPLIFDADTKKVIYDAECPYPHNFPITDEKIRQIETIVQTILYERTKRLEKR